MSIARRFNFTATRPVVPAGEGSEHQIAGLRRGQDAPPRKFLGECGEVRAFVGLRRECPHVANVPAAFGPPAKIEIVAGTKFLVHRRALRAIMKLPGRFSCRIMGIDFVWLVDRIGIPKVALGFGEHDDVLVRIGRPIFAALGHGIRLRPNDEASNPPAFFFPVSHQRQPAPRAPRALVSGTNLSA